MDSRFARVLTFVAKCCAGLFSRLPPPANQRMRRQSKCQKGLIARLLLLQPLHSANPIIEPTFSNPIIEPNFSQTIFPISIKLTRTQFSSQPKALQQRRLVFSSSLTTGWERRQHIVPPLVSPRQVFSTTVVQISCPAKLRDVHDERSPTDFSVARFP